MIGINMIPAERNFIIYVFTNTVNNKKYVGQTLGTLAKRWYKHCYDAIQGNRNAAFAGAIRKYGKDAFVGKVLEENVLACNVDARETFWIEALNTLVDNGFGYNRTTGGNTKGLTKLSAISCEKIAASKRGKPLVARTRKTDEMHRPVVEGFKAGKSRKELAVEFSLGEPRVVKILLRWKKLHEPDLPVGPEHQYASNGRTLQKNALIRNQPIIDMFVTGKSRREIANELKISYAQVKQVIGRYIKRNSK